MCTLLRRFHSLEFNWCYLNYTSRRCYSKSSCPCSSNTANDGRYRNSRNLRRGPEIPGRCATSANKDQKYRQDLRGVPKYLNEFSKLGLNSELVKLLEYNDISTPTRVQSEVIPLLLKRKSVVIASQTGSGKTLAFLLPLIQNMKPMPCSHLIIVPTRELASQIYQEALRYGVDKYSVARLVSGVNEANERSLMKSLKSPILIATPERLFDVVEDMPDKFNHVWSITMDEVDKLLISNKSLGSKKWMKRTKNLSKIRPAEKLFTMLAHRGTQVVASSATITAEVIEKLCSIGFSRQSLFIDMIPKAEPIPVNIGHHHFFVGGSTDTGRITDVARMLRISNPKSAMVFLSQEESVDGAVEVLNEMGFNTVALYQQLRLISTSSEASAFMKKFERGEIQVVVANEDVVRGMDFPFLDTIYITFLPSHYSTYVHLAGRVGRKGQPGRVITLLSGGKDDEEYEIHKKNLDLLGVKSTRLEIR